MDLKDQCLGDATRSWGLSFIPYLLELIQNYFSAMEQCFAFITFQHKHEHKPNFSISEQGVCFLKDPGSDARVSR